MTREALLKKTILKAGAVLRRRFGKVGYKQKRRADLLTIADLESQKTILAAITKTFPGDDFKAEENSEKITGAEYTWVVDPLDGTTNYAHGYPVSCVSIGVLRKGEPRLGGVYDPFRDELFLASYGKGTFLNGKRIGVSKTGRVSRSLLITGFAYDRAERADFYLKRFKAFIETCHDVRRSGSAALDMAWVAAGRADGFWEYELNPWDVVAGAVLISEAGGKVTDLAGRPWTDWRTFGKRTLATNGFIHREMVNVLRRIP